MNFLERVRDVRNRIQVACERVQRSPEEVKLIGVTKYIGPAEVMELYKAGLRNFGENRLQVAQPKLQAVHEKHLNDVTWHFIGHLQTRKVKDVIHEFQLIHSLDRWSLAVEIDKRANEQQITVPCLVQVNISGEESKGGLSAQDTLPFLESARELSHIKIIGLMTMAPIVDHPEDVRYVFRELRELRDGLQQQGFRDIKELSMGMSQDFEVAIEEGSTMVRVGRTLLPNSGAIDTENL